MTRFDDVRTDIDVDYMEHYRTGEVPRHLTILYEPKVIKVGQTRHMVQFRYDPTQNRFIWKIFNRPVIRSATNVPSLYPHRHSLDMTRANINLDQLVCIGYEDGEKLWTTTHVLMEDVVSFLKWYDVDSNGKIYAAVPGLIPLMTFGRQGTNFPPMKGNILFFNFYQLINFSNLNNFNIFSRYHCCP